MTTTIHLCGLAGIMRDTGVNDDAITGMGMATT
jgi:hypothetical protein